MIAKTRIEKLVVARLADSTSRDATSRRTSSVVVVGSSRATVCARRRSPCGGGGQKLDRDPRRSRRWASDDVSLSNCWPPRVFCRVSTLSALRCALSSAAVAGCRHSSTTTRLRDLTADGSTPKIVAVVVLRLDDFWRCAKRHDNRRSIAAGCRSTIDALRDSSLVVSRL